MTSPIFLSITAETIERLLADLRMLETFGTPGPSALAMAPVIDEWSLIPMPVAALAGRVTGHPHIADGHLARTTQIFAIDNLGMWARSANRFYQLGRSASGPVSRNAASDCN